VDHVEVNVMDSTLYGRDSLFFFCVASTVCPEEICVRSHHNSGCVWVRRLAQAMVDVFRGSLVPGCSEQQY
jgi:hypothetical protein